MKNIIAQENYALSSSSVNTFDMLDKATYPQSNRNSNYHHTLSIEDLNGYLYVLDYWEGITGEGCTNSIQIPLFKAYCSSLSLTSTGEVGGIKFGMLVMRIINTTGVDLPANPTFYNDLCQSAHTRFRSQHLPVPDLTAVDQKQNRCIKYPGLFAAIRAPLERHRCTVRCLRHFPVCCLRASFSDSRSKMEARCIRILCCLM